MRVALIIEYDGTNYAGWQIQPNGVTVQEVVENAFYRATGEKIKLVASGRTDSGVHALGQVAHFDTSLNRPAESFMHVLNGVLPDDVKIIDSYKVDENFHARYNAKRKTYRYSAYVSNILRPLKERYSARILQMPDLEKMNSAKELIIGEHDFSAFCSANASNKTSVRTVYSIDISVSGDDLTFTVCGNGFLYNMVRIIVGALIEVGLGKISLDDIKNALSVGDRKSLGKTMPSNGLTLVSVDYV